MFEGFSMLKLDKPHATGERSLLVGIRLQVSRTRRIYVVINFYRWTHGIIGPEIDGRPAIKLTAATFEVKTGLWMSMSISGHFN